MHNQPLSERVTSFRLNKLPGQGISTHMGTHYLIVDLVKEIEMLEATQEDFINQRDAAEKQNEHYADEINKLRNVIQSACIGGTQEMLKTWRQLFPDAPVPSIFHKPSEPEALRHSFDGYGWNYVDNGSGSNWMDRAKRHMDTEFLYTAPQPSDTHLRTMRIALKFAYVGGANNRANAIAALEAIPGVKA